MNRGKEGNKKSQISKPFPQERYIQAQVCAAQAEILCTGVRVAVLALILYCFVLCQLDPWSLPYVLRSIQALLYDVVGSIWRSTRIQPQFIIHVRDTFI